jgi:hypothetical protein
MANAVIAGNVVMLTVTSSHGALTLDMSLQRHHYRYCGSGTATQLNSLMYATVDDAKVVAEAVEVGVQIEALLKKSGTKVAVLFGKNLRVSSGRIYLVDNSTLNPQGFPNHFFVTQGPDVWGAMSANQYVAASAIRRVDEAIAARRAFGDTVNYLDAKVLQAKWAEPGGQNPVVTSYLAAHTALLPVPDADTALGRVSGQPVIVARARARF